VFDTLTDHHEFVGLWQDGAPKVGVMKVLLSPMPPAASSRHADATCSFQPSRVRPQVYRIQAAAPRGFYRLPKRVDVGEVNASCDLQGEPIPMFTTGFLLCCPAVSVDV
jgi:hypothetical protein